jgi:hypothetical protein
MKPKKIRSISIKIVILSVLVTFNFHEVINADKISFFLGVTLCNLVNSLTRKYE